MIVAHLTKYWLAYREQACRKAWALSIARSLRVLLFYREHQRLCQLDIVRHYVAALPAGDLFHHLSHREYLIRKLPLRRRVDCVLRHYAFEDATFNTAYKYAVYRAGGLTLWRRSAGGSEFSITLSMASRAAATGDLTIRLEVDGACLHHLSFSWIDGSVTGVDSPVVPFVAHNEGTAASAYPALYTFGRAFPNNSPAFFCFSAMQGVAQAVGVTQLVGIKGGAHPACDQATARHFARACDRFWKILGGIELPGPGYLVALPFYLKPLPANHRRRAALRRESWAEIGKAARATLERMLKREALQA